MICAIIFFTAWLGGHRAAAAGAIEPTRSDLRQGLRVERDRVTTAHERRCRPAPRYYKRIRDMGYRRLERGIRSRQRALAAVRERRWICNEEARVIELVFDNGTAYAAKAVAYCESKLWRWAHNPSGASGLFQLMPVHWAGRFNPYHTLRNAEYSWRLSAHGYDWSAWVCSP